MNQALIITSINPPRKEVKQFNKLKNWTTINVGDLKTPKDWSHGNVIYLSPKDQDKLFPLISKVHPWKLYARKNLGYLYAIKMGAKVICETDDDVFLYDNFPPDFSKDKDITMLSGQKFINIYNFYRKSKDKNKQIWPRGFPLEYLHDNKQIEQKKTRVFAPMQNSVIDQNSDFDAVYRLVNDGWADFKRTGEFAIAKGSYCPVNTQNTFTHPEAYALLYLPTFCNPRSEDIWSRYISQRIIWEIGGNMVFTYPTAYTSDRNPHVYLRDFELEVPLYLHTAKLIKILDSLSLSKDIHKSLLKVYSALVKEGILPKEELTVVAAWIKEIEKLDYLKLVD